MFTEPTSCILLFVQHQVDRISGDLAFNFSTYLYIFPEVDRVSKFLKTLLIESNHFTGIVNNVRMVKTWRISFWIVSRKAGVRRRVRRHDHQHMFVYCACMIQSMWLTKGYDTSFSVLEKRAVIGESAKTKNSFSSVFLFFLINVQFWWLTSYQYDIEIDF